MPGNQPRFAWGLSRERKAADAGKSAAAAGPIPNTPRGVY